MYLVNLNILQSFGKRLTFIGLAVVLGLSAVMFYSPLPANASHGGEWHTTERISVDSSGNQANAVSYQPKISSDGRYIVFSSEGSLSSEVPAGSPSQVYIRDRQTAITELVSKSTESVIANGNSGVLDLSDDGRFVVFQSQATSLSSEESGGLFVRDRQQSTTKQIFALPQGHLMGSVGSVSSNGRYVVFSTTAPLSPNDIEYDGSWDIYLFDMQSDSFELISAYAEGPYAGNATGSSGWPALSEDGNVVTFRSQAELSPNDTGNNMLDVYVYNRTTDEFELVSVNNDGIKGSAHSQGSSISADGRYVAFTSQSTNLGPSGKSGVFLRDLDSNTTTEVIAGTRTGVDHTAISGDGMYVVSSHIIPDTTGIQGAYVYNRDESTLTLASVNTVGSPGGNSYSPSINGDGSLLTFSTKATNLVTGVDTNFSLEDIVLASRDSSDVLAPVVSAPAWTANPKPVTGSTNITVPAADEEGDSGVAGGEYFIGDEDPGQGNGATMNWDGTNLSTTFGTDFPTGVYKINVRAQDNAGNWSEVVSDYLVVYDTGFRMTGRRTIIPSLSNGDVLPGLIDGEQDDKATFGFNVRYNNQGQIHQNSDLQFVYKTGRRCNGNNPENCHNLDLNAISIAWFATQGTNNSEGVFQGAADLVVDGASSIVMFKVTGLDGERLDPTSSDHFTLLIYAEGADPNTDEPEYTISADVTRGNIRILEI